MKAVVVTKFGGPEVLSYETIERPTIKPNQVLIRVEATSVNFADVKSRQGNGRGNEPPFVPGLDAAGVIEEIGPNITGFYVGQRVIAFPAQGSYAEYVVADAELTLALPDSIDFETAAACPIVSFTSYLLLHNVGRITHGETVLIHAAAGGIGTTAIQLAKILGAEKVIGTVGNSKKASIALKAGADHVIDLATDDFAKSVLELTQGRGADIILDSVSGTVAERSLDCLAMYGRLIQFGNASGHSGKFQTKDLYTSCRSVMGFSFGTTRKQRPYLLPSVAEKVFSYLEDGRLKMEIGSRLPLEQAAEGHSLLENRKSTGKVLLIPDHSELNR